MNVTAITLDDGTMMTRLARVGPMEFAFQTEELELGRHEVAYTAEDDAGNEFRGTYTFSVVERTPYELDLLPGWNLISVPGTPADPSLDAVLPPRRARLSRAVVPGRRLGDGVRERRRRMGAGTSRPSRRAPSTGCSRRRSRPYRR